MVANLKFITLLISSPSDMQEDRDIVEDTVNTINNIQGKTDGFRIECIDWKKDGRPNAGPEPQDKLNQIIGTNYDIFLGIMGNKFGTPTANYGSGTEEEFEIALKRNRAGEQVDIMFYFRDPKTAPGKIVASQLMEVEKFKSRLWDEKITTHDFASSEEFKTHCLKHISASVKDVLAETVPNSIVTELMPIREAQPSHFDPLNNFRNVEHDDSAAEFDLFTIAEVIETEFEAFDVCGRQIRNEVERLGGRLVNATTKINKVDKSNPARLRKSVSPILDAFVMAQNDYVKQIAAVLPKLHQHLTNGLDAFRKISLFEEVNSPEENALQDRIEGLEQSLSYLLDQLTTFGQSMSSIPVLDTRMVRARKRVTAINQDMIAIFELSRDQILEIGSMSAD